ncbi:MAG: hypothetical protein ABSF80_03655 [Chitinispirillaceae bacterium]|jgi:hypothetical protein
MSRFLRRYLLFILSISWAETFAGVTNPNISAIGQLFGTYTDDSQSPAARKAALSLGETELVLDDALNPYFNGMFVLSIDANGVMDVEEAYATMVRGLPLNLAIKAGKFRLDFGKLNQAHPHAYPFIRTPRVLDPGAAKLLPGEESFDEPAVQASTLVPVTDNWSVTLSADALQGSSFHPDDPGTAIAWLSHLSNSFIIDPASIDIGLSATDGTNDVARRSHTAVFGVDAKAKMALSPLLAITVAGEGIYKAADLPDSSGAVRRDDRYGFYGYANAQYRTRYNGGVLYERYQNPADMTKSDWAIKPFIGFAVLEESTLVRLSYERFTPAAGRADNTVEVQLLFSMGPHKAHQF